VTHTKHFGAKKCQAIRFEGERKCQSRRISWEFKLKSPYLDNRLPEYNSILKFSFLSNLWANLAIPLVDDCHLAYIPKIWGEKYFKMLIMHTLCNS
jgi:hypothetical protein